MGVDSHSYSGFGGGKGGSGGRHARGTNPGWVGRMSEDAGALPQ